MALSSLGRIRCHCPAGLLGVPLGPLQVAGGLWLTLRREQCSGSGPPAGIASEGRQEGEEDERRRWRRGSEDSTGAADVLGSLCVACGPMRQRCHSWEQELGWGLLHPRHRADPSC